MEALAAALEDLGVRSRLLPVGEPFAPAPIVVVDSYDTRADEIPRVPRCILAAIDDLERDLAVDLLVDPNPGGDPQRHGRAAHTLLGPRYALLGPVPAALTTRPASRAVTSILVTFGATGADGLAGRVAVALARRLPDATIRVVAGTPDADPPTGVESVTAHDGLFAELAASDLVVTAGGVTMLESLLLGRPTVAVATADNQRRAVGGAAAAGVVSAVPLDAPVAELVDRVVDLTMVLASDTEQRRTLAARGPEHIDGRGASRVAEALVALV